MFLKRGCSFGTYQNTVVDSIIKNMTPITRENFKKEKREKEVTEERGEASPNPKTRVKSNPPRKAARLPYFSQAWHQVTENSFILNIVCNGYKIQFIRPPYQYNYSPRNMSSKNSKICKSKVETFINNGIIKTVSPNHDQFLSHIFPVPKKTLDEFRIILDLTELNKFVRKVKFRMDKITDIMSIIKPGDFLVSIDLSDAYFCIAMHILSVPFLTFIFMRIYYQFTCLPQGLTSAPRIFTKIIRVILTFLRCQTIRISAWLDDFLLAAHSKQLCEEHSFTTIRTFEELGFIPNIEKSQLTPSQKLLHLGLIWDTLEFSVSIPKDKILAVKRKCTIALSYRVTVRFLSSILGSIEFFKWGFPHAAFHYRRLQRFINSCLARGLSYDHYTSASSKACIDLTWWSKVGDSLPSRSLFPFKASKEVTCDASKSGWGCWTSDNKEAFGFWSSLEKEKHINILEFFAVSFAFQCFFRYSFDMNILIKTDSQTAVSFINKQGGTSSARLCDMALDLWEFCIERKLSIVAVHIPGIKNTRADRLSRLVNSDHSYFLVENYFNLIKENLPFSLKIDCFASRLNFKLENFISRFLDPLSSCIDAFTVKWVDHVYLFPPISIVHKVISKLISDKTGHGLLICPYWPSQSWFPSLLELLIAPPFLIPLEMVVDEDNRLPRKCQLVGWSIGSSLAERMEYQKGLQSMGSKALIKKPLYHIKNVGKNSVIGYINGKVVTVVLL